MGVLKIKHERLWTIQDVANYLQFGVSWVYKRSAPKNTKFYPKIPRVANCGRPRFDPEVIRELFPTGKVQDSSLKIKELENRHSKNALPLKERKFKRL